MNIAQKRLETLREKTILDTDAVHAGLVLAVRQGWAFVPKAISSLACEEMEREVTRLDLEEGDHIATPINAGTQTEVRQLHARAYHDIEDSRVVIAKTIRDALVRCALTCTADTIRGELGAWLPTEAGYQRYRTSSDYISPHRDRRNDQILGATLTINGSAVISIHESIGNEDDYTQLKEVRQFTTNPGDLMLLRAPGLGNGEQAIHGVHPPRQGSRLILNLRMRPDVLSRPSQEVPHEE